MKEQVSDILQVLNDQMSEMQSMREVIDVLHAENINLCRNTESLQKEIHMLRKRLEKYEST